VPFITAGVVIDQAESQKHRAEDRFGGGDRQASDVLAEHVDAGLQGGKACQCGSRAGGECRVVAGISPYQRLGQCLHECGHGRGIVPNMRVVTWLAVQQVGHHDAVLGGVCGVGGQPVDPGIVADAVLYHDGRTRHRAGDGGGGFELVGVAGGIAQDRCDVDGRACDLARDVGIDALGGDDLGLGHDAGERPEKQ
jgi:hypothetical protein